MELAPIIITYITVSLNEEVIFGNDFLDNK